ncbi:hypothetical protein [Kroppenstedtia sanguinis]|uniref:hypothetical protein n=1 Tax=Kroppenstedtia sanguinis TaxID=1380684 RepID=UPI0036D4357E
MVKPYMGITPIYRRRNIYLALEGLDFTFDEDDLPDVIRKWEEGFSIWDMAEAMNRDPDEIAVLIMSLSREGKIERRPGAALGRRKAGFGKQRRRGGERGKRSLLS